MSTEAYYHLSLMCFVLVKKVSIRSCSTGDPMVAAWTKFIEVSWWGLPPFLLLCHITLHPCFVFCLLTKMWTVHAISISFGYRTRSDKEQKPANCLSKKFKLTYADNHAWAAK